MKKEDMKSVPFGPAAGQTAVYAVSLLLFLVCGVWIPHRNFNLMEKRIGQAGSMPAVTLRAHELTDVLFRWQGILIVLFIALILYFWWTSTWKRSMASMGTRFILVCVPIGLYLLMMWILINLTIPLRIIKETVVK